MDKRQWYENQLNHFWTDVFCRTTENAIDIKY